MSSHIHKVSFELEPGAVGQVTDFKEQNKKVEWGLKKIVGGSEHTLRAKLTFSHESHGNLTKEAGPVSMTFTIPMYNCSRLQVKYLQIAKKSKTYNPYRWDDAWLCYKRGRAAEASNGVERRLGRE
nr:AP-4 complex subunit mu [Tanacetum cinerariifolium]